MEVTLGWVTLGWVNETRIREVRVAVIPRGLNIFVESRHRGRSPGPSACLLPGRAVIEVVIDNYGRFVLVDLRSVQRHKAAWSRVDDVVLENVVGHVPLHLELTGLCV